MADTDLYLGRDGAGGQAVLDADHLTTHAVCLGMTGSGKTGLGVIVLEELARRGVPLLVIDLKGDMVNLLLSFPGLSGPEFEPWLPVDAVEGGDRAAVAVEQAERWRKGLEGSGLGEQDLRAVRSGLRWRLLTPGAGAAAPLDILPALSAPPGWDPEADQDAATDRVNGVTSALLSLIGRGGDPLSDRDHVLVASVVLDAWRRGRELDLRGLLSSLAEPALEVLGALPLDVFYPRDERMKLVLALNTLLASPAFRAWTEGTPLAMDHLLGSPAEPCGTIVSVAHLDHRQRVFVLALLASELVAWMRRQPASGGLRALLYVDEVQGILPPHPANPPTKGPLLTLLKQGRAFGVGAWLATQNPVDLDYKALGNAGVKAIGRLVTERDRERALEGLGMRHLADGRNAETVVASLAKREFLLDDVRSSPRVTQFKTRWAMSYLRGPVTLAEMEPLLSRDEGSSAPKTVPPPEPRSPTGQAPRGSSTPPLVAADTPVVFAGDLEGEVRPWVLVSNSVMVERRTIGLQRQLDEWRRVPVDDAGKVIWSEGELLDTPPQRQAQPSPGMVFPVAVGSDLADELEKAAKRFVVWRARQPVVTLVNAKLKLVAEPGETRDQLLERCLEAADRADDTQQERARVRFERRMQTLRKRLGREEDELERDEAQLQSRRTEQRLGVVEGLLSVLLGSRSVRSAASKAGSRARSVASKRRMTEKARFSVVESEREIERLEAELEDLASEMEEEIERIAAESETKAEQIEELEIRPTRTNVTVRSVELLWT